jgi:hypothetical protein
VIGGDRLLGRGVAPAEIPDGPERRGGTTGSPPAKREDRFLSRCWAVRQTAAPSYRVPCLRASRRSCQRWPRSGALLSPTPAAERLLLPRPCRRSVIRGH